LARNQDYELCLRVRRAGGTVWLDPAIRSVTVTRSDPLALARQYAGYGRGRAMTARLHPGSLLPRQLVPALFVAALGGAAVAAPVSGAARRALKGLVLVYGAVVAAFTWLARDPGNVRVTARLPAAFAIMHLAWGAGFWGESRAALVRAAASRQRGPSR
jgi:hypothetical protein